jgi:hypothetical protein
MSTWLGKSTKAQLLQRALSISRQGGFPAPDRMARRHRDALICWYCQFCPTIAGDGEPAIHSTALPFPEIPELSSTCLPDADILASPSGGTQLCGWAF